MEVLIIGSPYIAKSMNNFIQLPEGGQDARHFTLRVRARHAFTSKMRHFFYRLFTCHYQSCARTISQSCITNLSFMP